MPKHVDESIDPSPEAPAFLVEDGAPEPVTPEPEPTEPEPTDPQPGPYDEVPVEPTPGDPKPTAPLGSVQDRALELAQSCEDEAVRETLLTALAVQGVYNEDQDLRRRMTTSDDIRAMIRWIRTNVPSSASFKTFMEAVNTYLVKVETEGIPSLWSREAEQAPVNELMARRDAMAVEKAIAALEVKDSENPDADPDIKRVPGHLMREYARNLRSGKVK